MSTLQNARSKAQKNKAEVDPAKCPIIDKVSKRTFDEYSPAKTFVLALAYALSVARQEDLAKALHVEQSTVCRWAQGHMPRPVNIEHLTKRIASFVERRGRKTRRVRELVEGVIA